MEPKRGRESLLSEIIGVNWNPRKREWVSAFKVNKICKVTHGVKDLRSAQINSKGYSSLIVSIICIYIHTIPSQNSHHPGAYWKSQHQSEAQRAREWEVKVEELLHDIQCVFGKRFCRRETDRPCYVWNQIDMFVVYHI